MLVTVVASAALAASPASAQPGAGGERPVPAEREPRHGAYVVVLDDGATAADVSEVADAADAAGADVVDTVHEVVGAVVVEDAGAVVDELAGLPGVVAVEPDVVWRAADVITQDGASWGLDRIDQAGLPLNGTYRHDGTGTGVRVYVVDSGVRDGHAEFAGRVETGWAAVDDGWGTDDCEGHGTSVAGIIAGTTYGVAKGATVVPVRVLDCAGEAFLSDVVAALEWVSVNATPPAVVNLSLGGPRSTAVDAAVRDLVAAGIPVVAAAGNDGDDACLTSPAAEPQAITVAATDVTDARPWWSNHGSCVDLFAPGEDVVSAAGWTAGGDRTTTGSVTTSGTSFSAPYVAGVAALALEDLPTATSAEIAELVTGTATLGRVQARGAGSPDRLLRVPAPAGFVPRAPSRMASGVVLGGGRSTVVPLPAAVPPGATAVAVNVTTSRATAATHVSVCPSEVPSDSCRTVSAVNPYPGYHVANLALPQVGQQRSLRLYNNAGSVRVDVDLLGWFVPDGGSDFVAIPPARDDERPVIGQRSSAVVTLSELPAGTTSVAVRVTVGSVTGSTHVSVCPVSVPDATCATSSTLNASARNGSNLALVPVGADGRIRVYNHAGSVRAYLDVTGFFVPEGTGSRYVARPPTRVLAGAGIGGGSPLTRLQTPVVPGDATAAAMNVTTSRPTLRSHIAVCPSDMPSTSCDDTSTANLNPGQTTAATTLLGTGPLSGVTYLLNLGTARLDVDAQGYFLP
jgi:subtilisin family serine protease